MEEEVTDKSIARVEGYQAYGTGEENPHWHGTPAWWEWWRGWREAQNEFAYKVQREGESQ